MFVCVCVCVLLDCIFRALKSSFVCRCMLLATAQKHSAIKPVPASARRVYFPICASRFFPVDFPLISILAASYDSSTPEDLFCHHGTAAAWLRCRHRRRIEEKKS